ncbi:MAG: glycoprotease [Selenomonadaceae bacterium]|nr:glycoprotease [Selenomonadaceae bacterium]
MEQIKARWKELLLLIFGTALVIGAMWVFFRWQQAQQETLHKAQEVTQAQEQTVSDLRNRLKISEDNGRELASRVQSIQQTQNATVVPDTRKKETTPVITFVVPAATAGEASASLTERINRGDASLPDEATRASDRTIVTAITTDTQTGAELPAEEQRVDVYKIDLRKDHRIKAGIAAVDGNAYMVAGYEQGRVEGLVFAGQRGAGGALLYNIAEW